LVIVLNNEADGELKLLRRTDKLVKKSSKIVPLGAPLISAASYQQHPRLP
jgi:hypothetical protein